MCWMYVCIDVRTSEIWIIFRLSKLWSNYELNYPLRRVSYKQTGKCLNAIIIDRNIWISIIINKSQNAHCRLMMCRTNKISMFAIAFYYSCTEDMWYFKIGATILKWILLFLIHEIAEIVIVLTLFFPLRTMNLRKEKKIIFFVLHYCE